MYLRDQTNFSLIITITSIYLRCYNWNALINNCFIELYRINMSEGWPFVQEHAVESRDYYTLTKAQRVEGPSYFIDTCALFSYYYGPHCCSSFWSTAKHRLLTATHGHTPSFIFYPSFLFSSGKPSPRIASSNQHRTLHLHNGLKPSQFHPSA